VSSEVPGSTAEVALLGTFLDQIRAVATEFLERQADEPPEWRDAAAMASHEYWLTADELAKINQAMHDVLAPYELRRRDDRPAGSRRVRIARLAVPRANAEPGQRDGTEGG